MYPFPRNIAADLDTDPRTGQFDSSMKLSKEIFQWMLQNYIWPQMWERKPYEKQWDELLDMARATWEFDKLDIDPKSRAAKSERLKRAQEQEEEIIEINKQDKPVKLKLVFPNGNGKQKEYCLDLKPENDDSDDDE